MKFDFTHGKSAKYLVSVHRWDISDQYYVHSMKDAKEIFENLKVKNQPSDTTISIYDLIRDIRKDYVRV